MQNPQGAWLSSILDVALSMQRYWSDRRKMVREPHLIGASDNSDTLKQSPLFFAFNGVLLPSIIIGLLYPLMATFIDLPPTQIEREIEHEQHIVESFQKPSKPEPSRRRLSLLSPTSKFANLSDKQLNAELKADFQRLDVLNKKLKMTPAEDAEHHRLMAHAGGIIGAMVVHAQLNGVEPQGSKVFAEQRLALLRANKFLEIADGWRTIAASVGLLINAYLFGWWIRRLRPRPAHADAAVGMQLRALGLYLFFPNVAAAIQATVFSLAVHYGWDVVLRWSDYIGGAIAIWAFVQLVRVGRLLDRQIDPSTRSGFLGRMAWRSLLSQIAANTVAQLLVVIAAILILLLVSGTTTV